MRHLIALAAAALALSGLTPSAPAEAQTLARICVANQGGYIVRSRVVYTDWQGTRHTAAWTTLALGQRQCNLLQDISTLRIEVEAQQIAVWTALCAFDYQGSEARRTRTVFLVGTILDARCQVEA